PAPPNKATRTTRPVVDFPIDIVPLHEGFWLYACVEERRLGEQLWRSQCEGEETLARWEKSCVDGVGVNDNDGQRRDGPARGRCWDRNTHVSRTTGLRNRPMGLLVMAIAVMITRLRVRAGHRQTEHQRQHDPQG